MAITIDDSSAASSASSDLRSTQVDRPGQIQSDQQARQRQTESPDDSVNLSSLGAELARAISNEPPDVVNRIDQLQESVATNNFSVPAEEVADAAIQDSLGSEELDAQLQNNSNLQPASPTAP